MQCTSPATIRVLANPAKHLLVHLDLDIAYWEGSPRGWSVVYEAQKREPCRTTIQKNYSYSAQPFHIIGLVPSPLQKFAGKCMVCTCIAAYVFHRVI